MKIQIFMFLLLVPLVSALEINEVMYNPPGDDAGNEWVEIFNPGNLDLTNWTIGDLQSNDTLVPIKITNSTFALIAENSSAFNDSNASVYYAGSLIGNGLGNSGDTIYLYDLNKTLVGFLTYNNTFANGNNKTLEKSNNSWYESTADGGTPGVANSVLVFENLTNETANNTNTTNQTNSTNETNASETNQTTCISAISIGTAKDIFIDEPIKFRHIVNSSNENFSIIYWIEDLFGNIVKSEYETRTLTEKSYTPHPDERDKVYVIKSTLEGCSESYAEKTVIYKTNEEIAGTHVDSETNSSPSDESEAANNATKQKFSYELISYSEQIKQNSDANAVVRITSDESPHSIYVQAYIYRYSKKYSDIAEQEFTVEKLGSEVAELNFFTNATPGEYKMKIKITKDELKTPYEITENVTIIPDDEIEVEAGSEKNLAEEKNKTSTQITKNATVEINITNEPIVYQSKSAKSEELVPILIIAVLAVVSAVLIWKR